VLLRFEPALQMMVIDNLDFLKLANSEVAIESDWI